MAPQQSHITTVVSSHKLFLINPHINHSSASSHHFFPRLCSMADPFHVGVGSSSVCILSEHFLLFFFFPWQALLPANVLRGAQPTSALCRGPAGLLRLRLPRLTHQPSCQGAWIQRSQAANPPHSHSSQDGTPLLLASSGPWEGISSEPGREHRIAE